MPQPIARSPSVVSEPEDHSAARRDITLRPVPDALATSENAFPALAAAVSLLAFKRERFGATSSSCSDDTTVGRMSSDSELALSAASIKHRPARAAAARPRLL